MRSLVCSMYIVQSWRGRPKVSEYPYFATRNGLVDLIPSTYVYKGEYLELIIRSRM